MSGIMHQRKLPPLAYAKADPDVKELLSRVQGNVLKFHNRPFAAHILLKFSEDRDHLAEILTWLAGGADVSSAATQEDDNLFKMIGFTKAGLQVLGIQPERQPQDERFQRPTERHRKGIREQASTYPELREKHMEADSIYRGEIHAIVILAGPDKVSVSEDAWNPDGVPNHDGPLGPIMAAEILTTEYGHQLWQKFAGGSPVKDPPKRGPRPDDPAYVPIEWFGFRDGLSNPRFFDYDPARRPPGAVGARWDPFAPLSLVLTDDEDHGSYQGSYMAYWKLEQRVEELLGRNGVDYFARRWFGLTDLTVPLPPQRKEEALGLFFGRKRDGTPIIDASLGSDNNDFAYDADPDGIQCPFHAHIRRTNPRGDVTQGSRVGRSNDPRVADPAKRGWLMARRSMPYENEATEEKGLLFMSFQSTLENFELVVESADDQKFIRTSSSRAKRDWDRIGMDPIIGLAPKVCRPMGQSWPRPVGRPVEQLVWDYVRFKGGEYFYVPSLKEIAGLYMRSSLQAQVQKKLDTKNPE